MGVEINHISIKNGFWVQFKEQLISFGIHRLPRDIHFTISFNLQSPDINFHITKNSKDPANKPKITLLRLNKKMLEEILPLISLSLLNKILKPLDIDKLKNKYDNLGFISFDSLTNNDTSFLSEDKLIDSFKAISKFRGKNRLKINGDIESTLEEFAKSKELNLDLIKNIVAIPTDFNKPIECGIILSEEDSISALYINNKWFTLWKPNRPLDLFSVFLNPDLVKQIIWKTKRALIAIKSANTFDDVKHLNTPIRLVKVKRK